MVGKSSPPAARMANHKKIISQGLQIMLCRTLRSGDTHDLLPFFVKHFCPHPSPPLLGQQDDDSNVYLAGEEEDEVIQKVCCETSTCVHDNVLKRM